MNSTFNSNDTLTYHRDKSQSPTSASMCGRGDQGSHSDPDSDEDLDETVGNNGGADTMEYYDKLMVTFLIGFYCTNDVYSYSLNKLLLLYSFNVNVILNE